MADVAKIMHDEQVDEFYERKNLARQQTASHNHLEARLRAREKSHHPTNKATETKQVTSIENKKINLNETSSVPALTLVTSTPTNIDRNNMTAEEISAAVIAAEKKDELEEMALLDQKKIASHNHLEERLRKREASHHHPTAEAAAAATTTATTATTATAAATAATIEKTEATKEATTEEAATTPTTTATTTTSASTKQMLPLEEKIAAEHEHHHHHHHHHHDDTQETNQSTSNPVKSTKVTPIDSSTSDADFFVNSNVDQKNKTEYIDDEYRSDEDDDAFTTASKQKKKRDQSAQQAWELPCEDGEGMLEHEQKRIRALRLKQQEELLANQKPCLNAICNRWLLLAMIVAGILVGIAMLVLNKFTNTNRGT